MRAVLVALAIIGCGNVANQQPLDAAADALPGSCSAPADCASGVCIGERCQIPSCTDHVKNGDELDIDCAGSCGPESCNKDQACSENAQCTTHLCDGTFHVCVGPKRVFVTTEKFSGAQIGGLAGGDAKCQASAVAGGLGGTYRAWLSDLTGSPVTRFRPSYSAPYVRTDGTRIALDWTDLTDGTLDAPIDHTASGGVGTGGPGCGSTPIAVFTNTTALGTLFDPTMTCSNWTSNTGPTGYGRLTFTSLWSDGCYGGPEFCGNLEPLYCVEQ